MSGLSNYISTAMTGAIRLARFNDDGMHFFDISTRGFWLSFLAPVLVAPFFLMLLILRHYDAGGLGIFVHHIAIESLAYVIAWVLFPLIMASLTRMLGCSENFVAFIIAYNWCGALQNGVYLPIAILAHTGALSSDLSNTFALTAIVWVLAFNFFIIRTTLMIAAGTAFGIVTLDFVLSLIIDALTNRFL
jgi:hypothetical protein